MSSSGSGVDAGPPAATSEERDAAAAGQGRDAASDAQAVDDAATDAEAGMAGEGDATASADAALGDATGTPVQDPNVVKVFVLAGQSNMVGTGTVEPTQAHLERNGGQGTLTHLVKNPQTASDFAHLGSGPDAWRARDDVWLVDMSYDGPLTVTASTFGPELEFGHVMGELYENPVLIIKVAWGGKSLYVDFRPPSSGGEVGPYYTALVERVHAVLDGLGSEFFSAYPGAGYELAGIGWHQGWNDRVNQDANNEYQTNCVNLINDLRQEFELPRLPFVIATTGMTGPTETHPRALSLMDAQRAVPSDERLKEGQVAVVDTVNYWRAASESPADQGYHWNRNAETYLLIGRGMAHAMGELIAQ